MPLTLLVVILHHNLAFKSPPPLSDEDDELIFPWTIEEDTTAPDPARDYLDTMDVVSYIQLLVKEKDV